MGPGRAHRATECPNGNFPTGWGKDAWPRSSPCLNVLDSVARRCHRHQVGLAQPRCLDSPELAIRSAVGNIPHSAIQAGAGNFPRRPELRVQAEGRQFSHMLKRPELLPLDFDLAATGVAELMDEEGEEDYRPDEQSTEKQN